jgi:hypothetical protein
VRQYAVLAAVLAFEIAAIFGWTCCSKASAAVDRAVIESVEAETSLLDQAKRGDLAIKALVRLGCFELRVGGHTAEWQTWCRDLSFIDGYLERMVLAKDLGDHAPLSLWLAMFSDMLELAIGPKAMSFLHLDDIDVLNYGIPVVFNPEAENAWCLETPGGDCRKEYGLHFTPFSGVCAYWAAYIGCTGATWGGGIVFICTPIGMATEYLVVKYVAPKVGPKIYDRANRD